MIICFFTQLHDREQLDKILPAELPVLPVERFIVISALFLPCQRISLPLRAQFPDLRHIRVIVRKDKKRLTGQSQCLHFFHIACRIL